jgi:membrane fusion protein (multidrug efflux system)
MIIAVGITATIVVSHMLRTDPKKAMRVHGPMPVRLAQAKVTAINDVIGASGETEEIERVLLTARISQPVLSVRVNVGDRVSQGQILVSFEQRVIQASVDEAKEARNRAQGNREYCELNLTRLLRLYDQKLIAKVELEAASQQVKEAQWQLQSAMGQLERALQDLSNTTVKSPITGIVLERSINVGEAPKLDAPLVTLGLIDTIFMKSRVPENEITQVHLKQEAEVVLDSFRNEVFTGEIVKIDPSSDTTTKTFTAYIRLPNEGLRLTPGLTGYARIRNSKTAMAVPSICIMNPMGQTATVFYVDSASVAHIQRVKIGIAAGGLTEIVDGLKEGDAVVAAGMQFLKDGDRVNSMEDRT